MLSEMDIYAPNYIPLWLKAVNESHANQYFSSPPLPRIDYSKYVSRFAGSSFVSPVQRVELPAFLRTPPTSTPKWHVDAYIEYWFDLLRYEFGEQSAQLEALCLYDVTLVHSPRHGPTTFTVHVPGIRENAPRIDLGDSVNVRPLHKAFDRIGEATAKWYLDGGKESGLLAPGFRGDSYQAVVWALDRRHGQIILRVDGFTGTSNDGFMSPVKCNVIFGLQQSRCEPLYRAVVSVRRASDNPWLCSMLTPGSSDTVIQKELSPAFFKLPWVDLLNWEQKKAVNAVVDADYGNIPFLIFGPPGTGKTKTIVEMALQLLAQSSHGTEQDSRQQSSTTMKNHHHHLLICAPSESAADTLATRLASSLNPMQLLRLNGSTRTFAEVPENLLPYTYVDVENNLFTLPPFEILMKYQAVVTTCHDADMLIQAQLTNEALSHQLSRLTELVTSKKVQQSLHWTALLLDEAGQAIEPEALIPLRVIMPPESYSGPSPQFIAAGDEYQLGPKLIAKEHTALRVSLFQRLSEREVYRDHPLSRLNGARALSKEMLPIARPPFANLFRNYRSHPAILAIPSMLFYNDTLVPEQPDTSLVQEWTGWASPSKWPVLFVQNDSNDDIESVIQGSGTGSGTLFNKEEANIALRQVQSLLKFSQNYDNNTAPITPKDITIMTPFRTQVNYLRQVFRQNNLFAVNIGPLEAFQGLESRIVMICTTRTRIGPKDSPDKYVRTDQSLDLGLIDQPKRFNVAITRAKEGLIVIGNAACLTSTDDEHWTAFLNFCKRNGCYEGDLGWFQRKKTDVGRLERALKYKQFPKNVVKTNGNTSGFQLRGPQPEMDDMTNAMRDTALSAVNDFIWDEGESGYDDRDEDEDEDEDRGEGDGNEQDNKNGNKNGERGRNHTHDRIHIGNGIGNGSGNKNGNGNGFDGTEIQSL